MANKLLWDATYTSRGTVTTTELNSLANAAYATGTVYDNTTLLDQYGACQVYLGSLNPAAGAYVALFLVQSVDGTNYEDAPVVTTNPGYHMQIATMSVLDTTAAHYINSPVFRLPPGKFKIALLNGTGIALAATSNTITLYTTDDEVQ